jgi:hypothetical protein
MFQVEIKLFKMVLLILGFGEYILKLIVLKMIQIQHLHSFKQNQNQTYEFLLQRVNPIAKNKQYHWSTRIFDFIIVILKQSSVSQKRKKEKKGSP